MKSTTFITTGLVSLVGASPLQSRQLLDLSLLDAAPNPVVHSISIEEKPHTVQFDLAAATDAAIAAPLHPGSLHLGPLIGRAVETRTDDACKPLTLGAGPVLETDSAEAFVAADIFASAAIDAHTPTGYTQTFANLKASNSAYGYSGYSTLNSYDTEECARRCNNIESCSAFNIYFERDPSIVPAPSCANPASTTEIKCVYWGGYISANNANNYGQWREQFHVVIAGSNGYVKNGVVSVDGYHGVSLGNAAINAPLNCVGQDTYMGVKIFTTSFFDVGLCAAACASQNEYNIAHPPAVGSPKICQFFVTYLSHRNGTPEGQICALYTQSWSKKYATNDVSLPAVYYACSRRSNQTLQGQWRGNDHYTNDYVFAYTSNSYTSTTNCTVSS